MGGRSCVTTCGLLLDTTAGSGRQVLGRRSPGRGWPPGRPLTSAPRLFKPPPPPPPRNVQNFAHNPGGAPPSSEMCRTLHTIRGGGPPPQKCAKIHKGDPYNFLHTLEEGPPPQKCAKLISKRGSGCEGGGPYSSCRTTGSCRHKALLSRIEGGFQSKKTLYRCRRL